MDKIREFLDMSAEISAARIVLKKRKQKITLYQDVYDLNGKNKCDACINQFERVRLPNGQINDEGGITVYCKHLYDNRSCCDVFRCSLAKQYDRFCYIKLKQELDEAVAVRRAFMRNLFRLNLSK